MPDLPTLTAATLEYLRALDASRTMYVQTARNAPREDQVRASKRARLDRAEAALRAAAEEDDDG